MNTLIISTAKAAAERRLCLADRNLFSDRLEKCLLDISSASALMVDRRIRRWHAENMSRLVDTVEAMIRHRRRTAFLETAGAVLIREASLRAAARVNKARCLEEMMPAVRARAALRARARDVITRGVPREFRLRSVRRTAVAHRPILHASLRRRVWEKEQEQRVLRSHAVHADAMREIRERHRRILRPTTTTTITAAPEMMDDGATVMMMAMIVFMPMIILFLLVGRAVVCLDEAARGILVWMLPREKKAPNRSFRRAEFLRRRKIQKKNRRRA
ncbi:hypothetical protein EBZ80_06520 [bacterium]|nr:hypothetical protein [bacterium]